YTKVLKNTSKKQDYYNLYFTNIKFSRVNNP
ncbi:MAG: hypothetical protein ACI81I_000330, partial [Arcobacteraceae bacterium]